MNSPAPTRGRGAGWVAAQFALMAALLAAGPLWRAQWSGWWNLLVGGALVMLGAWAGIQGDRHLGRHRTPFPRPNTDGQLVTSGIYARVRHPLYLAVILLGFGWALLWRSAPALMVALVQLPFFDAKARVEEQWLRQKYPVYGDYARRVKRFIPGFY